jgi:hypothetical protein
MPKPTLPVSGEPAQAPPKARTADPRRENGAPAQPQASAAAPVREALPAVTEIVETVETVAVPFAAAEPPAAAQPIAQAVREPRIETIVGWPSLLVSAQRNTVRRELERQVRERLPAALKGDGRSAEQRIEIRVERVNVHLEGSAQPAPAPRMAASPMETPFAGFFLSRSLR